MPIPPACLTAPFQPQDHAHAHGITRRVVSHALLCCTDSGTADQAKPSKTSQGGRSGWFSQQTSFRAERPADSLEATYTDERRGTAPTNPIPCGRAGVEHSEEHDGRLPLSCGSSSTTRRTTITHRITFFRAGLWKKNVTLLQETPCPCHDAGEETLNFLHSRGGRSSGAPVAVSLRCVLNTTRDRTCTALGGAGRSWELRPVQPVAGSPTGARRRGRACGRPSVSGWWWWEAGRGTGEMCSTFPTTNTPPSRRDDAVNSN